MAETSVAMRELESIPSVLRVLDARPGDGARIVTGDERSEGGAAPQRSAQAI